MNKSHNDKPLYGAAAFTHAWKENSSDGTMIGGVRDALERAYNGGYNDGSKEGYRIGVLDTLNKLLNRNDKNTGLR